MMCVCVCVYVRMVFADPFVRHCMVVSIVHVAPGTAWPWGHSCRELSFNRSSHQGTFRDSPSEGYCNVVVGYLLNISSIHSFLWHVHKLQACVHLLKRQVGWGEFLESGWHLYSCKLPQLSPALSTCTGSAYVCIMLCWYHWNNAYVVLWCRYPEGKLLASWKQGKPETILKNLHVSIVYQLKRRDTTVD